MLRKNTPQFVIGIIILSPLWMLLFWFLTPKTKLVAAIIDKTVLTTEGQEHISLNWVLNHERLTKTASKLYQKSNDYFGFFPLKDEKFRLKGLERFSQEQLKQLSTDADLAYFTDTYGIYKNEWYIKKNETERSGMIYGGMSGQDVEFLKLMKAKHKLIIAEFNSIGSPTNEANRNQFENLFSMKWTGWTARYFESLDTTVNKELPRWLIRLYKEQHQNKWTFRKSGVAFVNDGGQIVILEDQVHLTNAIPQIISTDFGQKTFGLPAQIKYPFWFDIIKPDVKINKEIASFNIFTNANGKAELSRNGIPSKFPAVLMHNDADYRFYYFSGDFCDNQVNMTSSYFKGIGAFKWLFYNSNDPTERSSFFWNFYRPMMTNILTAEKNRKP